MPGSDIREASRPRALRWQVPGRIVALAVFSAGVWAAFAQAQGDISHAGESTRFLLAAATILVAAKVGGELFERMRQPAVLGELSFGIILGNLSLAGIDFFEGIQETPFLYIAAEIGVVLLLFEVGLKSNLGELLKVGPSATAVAVLGVIAPIALGYPASVVFMPSDAEWYSHLFVGCTLAATSVGITARVLKDIGKMEAPESKVIVGAAIVDDILGLLVLAFVLGLLRNSGPEEGAGLALLPMLLILCKAVGFFAGAILMTRTVIVPAIALIQRAQSSSVPIVMTMAYCFVMAALAEMVGLASIVGAFVAGLVVDDAVGKHFGEDVKLYRLYRIDRSVAPISAVFVPVFFVYMGLGVDLPLFAFSEVLIFAAVLSLVAVISKQVCSLGVMEKGINRWAVGVGMIPRGEVGLIFAGIGSTVMVGGRPVFSDETFSSVVAAVMVTTLATPPLLKAVFGNRTRNIVLPRSSATVSIPTAPADGSRVNRP